VSAVSRILIVKPSSLGDVIHALPTAARLRCRFPQAHIAWLVNDTLSSLLQRCPVINEIIPFARHHARQWYPLLRRLRTERFDLVVDLQGLLRSGIMTIATGAPRRIGLSDAREGSRLFYNEIVAVPRCHAVDRYLCVANHLGCEAGPVEFPLGLPSPVSDLRSQISNFKSPIAIHPTARWPTKLWGDERFAELVRRLPPDRVVLTGAASERDRIETIAQGRPNLAGKTSLLELAELYARCAVVVTNDSGPMHLAAAVGTPVVAIFGPTDPSLTGPYGNRHVVLRSAVDCSPCFKKHCVHRPPMECMEQVTVEQVLAAVNPFLV